MFKSFIATLILASIGLGLASQANAGPKQGSAPTAGETGYMDRASKTWDGPGN